MTLTSLGRTLIKSSGFTRSFITKSYIVPFSSLLPLRSLSVVANFNESSSSSITSTYTSRSFSTRTRLSDPSPNFNNRPPKETILLDGCDFEHWLIVVDKSKEELTRDEIIDQYIKIVASVVGSEQEARQKIYSVSTKHYFAIGVLVSEELSYKFKEMSNVKWVLPDSYLNVREKDYGGEPFINGQAVPYDPKYHEEWLRNKQDLERRRRDKGPRSKTFERRDNLQRRDGGSRGLPPPRGPMAGGPPGQRPNMEGPPQQYANVQNTGPQNGANYNPGPPRIAGPSGGYPNGGPSYNAGPGPDPAFSNTVPPNSGNMRYAPNGGGAQYQNGGEPGPMPKWGHGNGYAPPTSWNRGSPGPVPPYAGNVQYEPNGGGTPYQNSGGPGPMPNRGYENSYAPPTNRNRGPSGGNNAYQVRDVPGRD